MKVQLTSGGPVMTVTHVGERMYHDGLHAWCLWFDGAEPVEDVFPLIALKVVPPAE
ncbi:MAG: DUF2158 domain-containing protein [Acetobacteraceae bacterium]